MSSCPPLVPVNVKRRRRGDKRQRHNAGSRKVAAVKTCHSPTTLRGYETLPSPFLPRPRFGAQEGSGQAHSTARPWVHIGYHFTHKVHLLPFLSYLADPKSVSARLPARLTQIRRQLPLQKLLLHRATKTRPRCDRSRRKKYQLVSSSNRKCIANHERNEMNALCN